MKHELHPHVHAWSGKCCCPLRQTEFKHGPLYAHVSQQLITLYCNDMLQGRLLIAIVSSMLSRGCVVHHAGRGQTKLKHELHHHVPTLSGKWCCPFRQTELKPGPLYTHVRQQSTPLYSNDTLQGRLLVVIIRSVNSPGRAVHHAGRDQTELKHELHQHVLFRHPLPPVHARLS